MSHPTNAALDELASTLVLGALLGRLRSRFGGFDLVDHWQQGEFHHDTVLRLHRESPDLPARFLVVATNCNGGVKEVLCFAEAPSWGGLWKLRCPDSQEFQGHLPPILGRSVTHHWFDPRELLLPDARSELRPEFRERQVGGGWRAKKKRCGS